MRNQKVITATTYAVLAGAVCVSFVLPSSLTPRLASAASVPPKIRLNGVVRDFPASNTDFDATLSEAPGHVAGLVDYTLGANGLPIYDGSGNIVTSQARDAAGNNIAPVLANAGAAKGVNFNITNGKVVPSEAFVAKVTVLGSAMTNPYSDIRVTVRIKVGTTTIDPFGTFTSATGNGNVHDNNNPRNYIMSTAMAAGTAMSVTGRSWGLYEGSWMQFFNVDSIAGATGPGTSGTGGGTTMVKVLRNGDSVPNIPPFGSQSAIDSYLIGYINTTTKKVTIADNQAIFLFELASYDPASPYYDYQDLVVLITMAKSASAFAANPLVPTCGPTTDVNPVLGAATTAGITSVNSFKQWFADSLGKNMSASAPLDLVYDGSKYVFDSNTDPRYKALGGFYPADGRMLGDQNANGHNEDFTYSFETYFTYDQNISQFFNVSADAEVWVFIDNELVIDLGGFHGLMLQRVDLSRLCLTNGKKYKLSFFMAHRYSPQSSLKIQTNLNFSGDMPITVLAPID